MSDDLAALFAELGLDRIEAPAEPVAGLQAVVESAGELHSIDPEAPSSPQPFDPPGWENGYPTGCPLCAGRLAQPPSADDPGKPGPFLVCREHGAVYQQSGETWVLA